MQEYLFQYQHKTVRDIAWLIASTSLLRLSPCLTDDWYQQQYKLHENWLLDLDKNPELVQQWMTKTQPSFRLLGKYFEALLAFWLTHSPYYAPIVFNEVLKEGKQTLGEMDVVLQDTPTKAFYHWEVSVKYFLQCESSKNWCHFIGPNPKDTLQLKMDKLLNKQIKWTTHSTVHRRLMDWEIEHITPQILLKGYLFYHFSNSPQTRILPLHANAQHLMGWWCYADELPMLFQQHLFEKWMVLPRLHWLTPELRDNDADLYTHLALSDALLKRFQRKKTPVLLVGFVWENGVWKEVSRGFVVTRAWKQVFF